MTTYVEQFAYVTIRNGCPLRVDIRHNEIVEIVCGVSQNENFELLVEIEAFRELVMIGTAALDKMDTTATEAACA